jgi:toxin-antitoxin system PIN domain toxin
VNVLVSLAWPNHVHHQAAHAWFKQNRRHGWATSPLTQSGFVRVSSNPRIILEARQPGDALLLLRQMTALSGRVFWPDDIALASSRFVASERIVGHNQVTDAHLLALALRHGGRLATFDDEIPGLLPAGADGAAVVVLSPAA